MVTAWLAGALLVIAFIAGNLYKWTLFLPEVRFTALDIVVFVLTAISIFINYKSYFISLKKYSRLSTPLFTFGAIGLLTLVLSIPKYGPVAGIVAGLYLLRWVIYALFFVTLIQLFKAHELKKLGLGLGLLTVLVGLVQYSLYPDVRSLEVLEWDPHYYRVVGTWLDPGFTGLLLVFTLIYLVLNPLRNRLINLIAWSATYLTFALTYSRSSYLAFLAAMAWIAWKRKQGKFFVGMAGLLLVTTLLLPRAPGGEGVKLEREYSVWSRVQSWKQALAIWADHPVLGVGFNVYRYATGASLVSHAGAGADSSLLFVAATTGILGLAAYLWYLKRLFSLDPLPNYLIPALVHSLFLNSLFYPAVMVWLSLLIPYASGFQPDRKQ